jgi:hypothetical protein
MSDEFGPTCEEVAGSLEDWPNCRTADCENKACLAINSALCFPCACVSALLHQVHRNHDYNPNCSGCSLASKCINLKGRP